MIDLTAFYVIKESEALDIVGNHDFPDFDSDTCVNAIKYEVNRAPASEFDILISDRDLIPVLKDIIIGISAYSITYDETTAQKYYGISLPPEEEYEEIF